MTKFSRLAAAAAFVILSAPTMAQSPQGGVDTNSGQTQASPNGKFQQGRRVDGQPGVSDPTPPHPETETASKKRGRVAPR